MTLERRGELAKRERMNHAESQNARLIKLLIQTDKPARDRLIAEARRRWPDEFKASNEKGGQRGPPLRILDGCARVL
jgi:hypothetical protein